MKLWDYDLEIEEFQAEVARSTKKLLEDFNKFFAGQTEIKVRVRPPVDWTSEL